MSLTIHIESGACYSGGSCSGDAFGHTENFFFGARARIDTREKIAGKIRERRGCDRVASVRALSSPEIEIERRRQRRGEITSPACCEPNGAVSRSRDRRRTATVELRVRIAADDVSQAAASNPRLKIPGRSTRSLHRPKRHRHHDEQGPCRRSELNGINRIPTTTTPAGGQRRRTPATVLRPDLSGLPAGAGARHRSA